MLRHRRTSRLPLLIWLLASAAQGQDRTLVLERARATASAGCCVGWRDGVLRADAARFTAVFDAGGVSFTPALGRLAPRAFPVRFVTESVTRDGPPPPAIGPVAPRHDGLTVSYDRTDGVVERWCARPEGLEVSWVFARPVPGSGDLVVRLRVATDLAPVAATVAGDAEIRLHAPAPTGPGPGGVRIGAVTGIDASGGKAAGTSRLRDGILELRLPAAFVDGAEHPLVLDPLIGTEFTVATGHDAAHADVAYDSVSQQYLVVWQRDVDASYSTVLGRLIDAQGRPGQMVVIRDVAGFLATNPAVASVRNSGRFLVAWRQAGEILAPSTIVCRCVNADLSLSGVLSVPGATFDARYVEGPRLAGNATTTDTRVLLALAHPSAVEAIRIDVPGGTGAPVAVGALVSLESTTFFFPRRLAATRASGGIGRWLVAWEGFDPVTPGLKVRAIDVNGALGQTLALPALTDLQFAIDGEGSSYVLAYLRANDVFCQRLEVSGSSLTVAVGETPITNSATVKHDPAVSFLGLKYLVAWSDDGGVPLANDIRGLAIDALTCRSCDLPFTIARPASYDYEPAIAAQRSGFGNAGDEALIAFSAGSFVPPFASEVIGQRFDAIGAGGAITTLGGSCGGTFTFTTNGPLAIGNSSLALFLDGAAGAAGVVLGVAAPGSPVVPCGSCMVTVPFTLVPAPFRGTRAVTPFGILCDPSLVGAQLELQHWVLGTSATPCPMVPGLSFADRHLAQIGQ